MGFLTDLLFGTQAEAAKLNQQNVDKSLGFLSGVNLNAPFGAGREALMQGRQDLLQGFQQGIAGLGAAGTGAQLDTLARGRESLGMARQSLGQRGLYGSSLIGNAQAGINDQTSRTMAGIAGQTAAAQGGLAAQRGHALAGLQGGIADLWQNQAQMQLQRAGMQAQTLGNVQHQGSPGLLGTIISGGLGFLGGFYGVGGQQD